MKRGGELRFGISGWRYPGWRGKFYPKGLPQRRELEYASRILNSVELNGSFYSLQLPSSYQRWYSETPDDFVFAIKGPRYITHMKKLRHVKVPLANFFASGVLALREKIGPILWQLPPNLSWNKERLEEFFELLREHNIAFVFADTARKFPYAEDLTADLVYIRLHGAKKLYVSGYNNRALDCWANCIELWRTSKQPRNAKTVTHAKARAKNLDVFVYFDNDAKVHAPFDAQRLAARLGVK